MYFDVGVIESNLTLYVNGSGPYITSFFEESFGKLNFFVGNET